jgi:hypothetical protein
MRHDVDMAAQPSSDRGWLPIRYRDFWDLPRAMVVEWPGVSYFIDCIFDQGLDEYSRHYRVYQLPLEAVTDIDEMSWIDLEH